MAACQRCGIQLAPRGKGVRYFCASCGIEQTKETRRAMGRVRSAIVRGDLLPARSCLCVDCGAPAYGYEHRDYSKPLDVQPICRACNTKRGPALAFKLPDAPRGGFVGADPSVSEVLSLHGLKHAQPSHSTPLN